MQLKELRNQHRETSKEIASLLGVSRSAYTNYENGLRPLPLEYAVILATHWAVSIDTLVGFSVSENGAA